MSPAPVPVPVVTEAERQLVSEMEAFRKRHLERVRLLYIGVQSARELYEEGDCKKESPKNNKAVDTISRSLAAVDTISHSLAALIKLLDKFKLSITDRGGLDGIFIECVLEKHEYRCLNEECTTKRLTRILCLFSDNINQHFFTITHYSGPLSELRNELASMLKELNKIIDRYVNAA